MFEWDSANGAHVRQHGVEPEECEQALGDPEVMFVEERMVRGELR